MRGANADLMVDDAHAIGVCGASGEGVAGACSQQQIPILTATFGKALGVGGAFVAGSSALTNYLVQNCREYIYSTAFSAAQAAAINAAIQICRSDEGAERRSSCSKTFTDSEPVRPMHNCCYCRLQRLFRALFAARMTWRWQPVAT